MNVFAHFLTAQLPGKTQVISEISRNPVGILALSRIWASSQNDQTLVCLMSATFIVSSSHQIWIVCGNVYKKTIYAIATSPCSRLYFEKIRKLTRNETYNHCWNKSKSMGVAEIIILESWSLSQLLKEYWMVAWCYLCILNRTSFSVCDQYCRTNAGLEQHFQSSNSCHKSDFNYDNRSEAWQLKRHLSRSLPDY